MNTKYCYPLLKNVHLSIPIPLQTSGASESEITHLTRGDFIYFHYNCDFFNDAGWGCAYRTLQTMSSWIIRSSDTFSSKIEDKHKINTQQILSIPKIQETLVEIGDKKEDFIGSKEWIGALEISYVIDKLYNVQCKIVHVPNNEDLKMYANVLKTYFHDFGGIVMMGGDVDASSKGIAGIHMSRNQVYLLVIDPHFVGKAKSAQDLINQGYVRWQHTSEFLDSSFYNLCLPQIKPNHKLVT